MCACVHIEEHGSSSQLGFKKHLFCVHSQEEGRGRRRHEGIGELGRIHVTVPAEAGPRRTLVACASGRHVRAQGRQDAVQVAPSLSSHPKPQAAALLTLA